MFPVGNPTFPENRPMRHKIIADLDHTPPFLRELTVKMAKVNAVNLGQGVCIMPVPQEVKDGAIEAIQEGLNLYSPAAGVPRLREALAGKLNSFNKIACSADQVIITSGATGAFETVCQTLVGKGDVVVSFKPFYPYHHNALRRRGAKIRYVNLNPPKWSFDPQELEAAFSERTKFILLITPHNPTGKMFSHAELDLICGLCKKYDALCVTDEVYEYIRYDGRDHISPASRADFAERCVTMGAYSKTYAITGWRMGYLLPPVSLFEALRNVFDQAYVCAPVPFQHGVANGIEKLGPKYYQWLLQEYSRKRDMLNHALTQAGFVTYLPEGAYYIVADTRERFPNLSSEEVAELMIAKAKVGAVPASDFMGIEVKGRAGASSIMRFCYAVPDEALAQAAKNLMTL